jgi:hypothetical protein
MMRFKRTRSGNLSVLDITKSEAEVLQAVLAAHPDVYPLMALRAELQSFAPLYNPKEK